MTRNLLDTNVALFALSDPDRLLDPLREAILGGPNVLSVISYWEVVLKVMKGALDVGDPRRWWADALDQLSATPLCCYVPNTFRNCKACRPSIKIPSTAC